MLSASRRQPHLLHVSAVDRRQTWSMDKSWRCVTLSGFLHNHIVRCQWNPISCGTHYSGPGLSENDPVKSSPPTNKHPVFLQARCPSCHPTNSVKALKVIRRLKLPDFHTVISFQLLCLLPLPRRLCFHSVYLFVCSLVNRIMPKKYPIFIKFGGKVAHGPQKKPLDFEINLHLDLDPGIFKTKFLPLWAMVNSGWVVGYV